MGANGNGKQNEILRGEKLPDLLDAHSATFLKRVFMKRGVKVNADKGKVMMLNGGAKLE